MKRGHDSMAISADKMKTIRKYRGKGHDRIEIKPQKGAKERYQKEAERRGISLTQFIINCIEKEISDPFYSKENIAELERRIDAVRSGKSTLKEHELIEVD